MKTSDLEDSIKQLLVSTQARDEFDGVERQLSCRINVVRHYQIGVLADKLNMTRTSLAEHLLEQATVIAWNAAGLGALSETDISALKSLTKARETSRLNFCPEQFDRAHESGDTRPKAQPVPEPSEGRAMPPNRMNCIVRIFRHLGLEAGRLKGTIASSKDGSVRVCCLTSKDYEVEKEVPVGERYWFTIYEQQLADIQRAQSAYVAFACGFAQQIVLIPADEFLHWCDDLPPYTAGKIGWHVHLTKVSGSWELRRKGYREVPINTSSFVI